eukprot:2498902-Pleurochrysis_carterae.AAC.1
MCLQQFLRRKYGAQRAGHEVKKISSRQGDPKTSWEYYISDCTIFEELFSAAFRATHPGSARTWEPWQCSGTVRELPGG